MTTPHLGLETLAEAQDQPDVPVNYDLRVLDALVQLTVIDKDLTAPPGSPADGDRYIVGASATGAWLGEDLNVAAYLAGEWVFFTPVAGWSAYVQDEATEYRYAGGSPPSWAAVAAGSSTLSVTNLGSPGAIVAATSLLFSGAQVDDAGGGIALITIAQASGGGGGVQSVVAGTGVTVDNTDPLNPVVSATGGGGGGDAFDIGIDWNERLTTPSGSSTANLTNVGTANMALTGTTGRDTQADGATAIERVNWARFQTGAATGQEAYALEGTGNNSVMRTSDFTPLDGYKAEFHFAYSGSFAAAVKSDAVLIFGMISANAAPGGAAVPSAQTNCIFVGKDQGDTNLQLMHNDGSGTCTKIDLGVSAVTLSQIPLRLTLDAHTSLTAVDYEVRRLDTGVLVASGTITTDLTAKGQRLYPICWVNTGSSTTTLVRGYLGKVRILTPEGA